MKNFLLIATGVDVIPLLAAIQRQPHLWNENTLRTAHPDSAHCEADDIWLRFNDVETYRQTGDAATMVDEHESIWYPAIAALPQARDLILLVRTRVEGERLGRCLITKLRPGARIRPHVDGGSHASYYERYHLTLQASPGCNFRCGEETVYMAPGTLWWFNNQLEHHVTNNGADDRISLIIDIRAYHPPQQRSSSAAAAPPTAEVQAQ